MRLSRCVSTGILVCIVAALVPARTATADNSSAPVVREHILSQLENAQKLFEREAVEKSQNLLLSLTRANLSQYEYSQVYQLLAFQLYQLDQPLDAIQYYQQALKLTDLPDYTRKQNQYNLSQLYFSVEQYHSALEILSEWFQKNDNADANTYELLGQIQYYLENYRASIKAINAAIGLYQAANKPPRQNWLQLLQVMYYQLQDFQSSIRVQEQLIRFYPRKAHWLQLASLYAETGDNKKRLSVLDTAYLQGLLESETELKTLAYLYLAQNAPFKAAQILQQGLQDRHIESSEKNLTLTAEAWQAAKEIDLAIEFSQLAANVSTDGNSYTRLAQLYLSDDQFRQATMASRAAIDKGSLRQPGLAYNMLGISLYRQKQYQAALLAFREAETDAVAAPFARQWQQHMQNFVE